MMTVDLSDYYCGGYLLIRGHESPWDQVKDDPLLPNTLISLSECISDKLQVQWGWIPGDKEAALQFGIPETKLDEFITWCNKHEANLAIWSLFYSVAAARRFVERFLPHIANLYLIGIGLYHDMKLLTYPVNYSRFPDSLIKQIDSHLPLETGGTILGYEIVSYAYGDLSHSWLCGGINRDMHELFGIIPNQYGLIANYAEARKVYDWIAEDEMKGHRSEPEPYYPWLLVSYPLKLETE